MKKTPLEWKQYFETEQFDRDFRYDGEDLGVKAGAKETVFRVWAPTASAVVVNLYWGGVPDTDDRLDTIEMKKDVQGTWTVSVPKDLTNTYYTFSITANGRTQETQDVYARSCGVNGRRSMVVNLAQTDPAGWQDDVYMYDASCQPVIYELHIKDFSFSESSGIPKEYRGKYKAFTVEDSTLNGKGEKPTCLSYLKQLGITHVHLLPCYDFGSVDEAGDFDTQFNWGYDPVNYNVPEGSYATDAEDGRVRIREFKKMVQSLHRAGIGVIMDVVYNHTYSPDSCFQRTVPYYYYRVNDDGTLSNGSICSNDTASERSMYRKYMADSVCYWAKEYHIDGFRFDLMGLHDVETMNEIRRRLNELPGGEHILMYGEPWAGTKTAMREGCIAAVKKNVAHLDPGIAIFNDDTRDAIKGSVLTAELPGFVNGKQGLEPEICSSVLAWCDGKGGYKPHGPGQTITYVSAHDNWSLWDKLNYTMKHRPQDSSRGKSLTAEDFCSRDERILQANRFAAGIVMTSLGAVFFQAGEEAARTKLGIGDSYCSPPELNALDWERMYRFEDLMDYYKGMLSLRRLCAPYWSRGMEALGSIVFYEAKPGTLVFSVETETPEKNAKRADEKHAADGRQDHAWKRLWVVYATDGTSGKSSSAEGEQEQEKYTDVILPRAKRCLLSDGTTVFDEADKTGQFEEKEVVRVRRGGVTVFGEPWE